MMNIGKLAKKKLLKICQKLENSDFRFQKQPLGAFNFEKTILDQFSYENCIPQNSIFTLQLQVNFCVGKTEKQQNYFKKFCYLTCEQLLLRKFWDSRCQSLIVKCFRMYYILPFLFSTSLALNHYNNMKLLICIGIGPLGSLYHPDSIFPEDHFLNALKTLK